MTLNVDLIIIVYFITFLNQLSYFIFERRFHNGYI